jgi:tetratricopeptide (TPR) repeat protein
VAHPDFAQEINEAHRRLTAELEQLLTSFPNYAHCVHGVGHRYRSWAFVMEPYANYLAQVEHDHGEAVNQFAKLSHDDPKFPRVWFFLADTYIWRGDALRRLAKVDEAKASFGRAMEIYGEHAAEIEREKSADIAWDYFRIARFLAETHAENQNADFIRKAALSARRLTDPNAAADSLYYFAVVQLQLGDKAGYRASCKALVEVPLSKLDGNTKSRPVWTPCIGPEALDDMSQHVKRAEEFLTNGSPEQRHFGLQVLGAAHYRAGEYEEAAKRLKEAIAAYPTKPKPDHDTMNYQQLFLAMTHWQLGNKDEARKVLAETLPAVEAELKSPSSGWNRRTTLEVLRGEAEDLIEPTKPNESAENKSRTTDRTDQ